MSRARTLLVVDDEPDVLRSVHDLLRLDYRVLTATTTDDALRILKEQPVHVVMSDQRMPKMTGVEFLRIVRSDHPDVIRLLFTGYADIRAVIDAINTGHVFRYITKPWDPDELRSIIREACERYDLLSERQRLMLDLQHKNDALEQANLELHAANELKSAFIKVASHELRTPLTILVGVTELAERETVATEPLRGWLRRIHGAAQRLVYLVNQIVSMLSVGNFDRKLEPRSVPIDALLATAVEDIEPFVALRNQRLERSWSSALGEATVVPERIRDALNHLLLNAVKFTPDGGTITVAAEREPSAIRIDVRDTGIGVPAGDLPHLFEPFFTGFQVERHSSGQFEYGRKGLGLGLSVVKAFVDQHGGTLYVDSKVGQGTTFTMRLPVPEHP